MSAFFTSILQQIFKRTFDPSPSLQIYDCFYERPQIQIPNHEILTDLRMYARGGTLQQRDFLAPSKRTASYEENYGSNYSIY